jgi:hypothetical protein
VLISLGILTLGLLGVAAVFPVGSWYMMKANIADNGSAIAQAVMNDIVTRGTVNPKAWYVMVPAPSGGAGTVDQNWILPGIDGKYTLFPNAQYAPTFTRPFNEALARGLTITTDPVTISKQFGSAYVIDPLFAAAAVPTPYPGASVNTPPTGQAVSTHNRAAYGFPATALNLYPGYGGTKNYYKAAGWNPWKEPTKGPPQTPTQLTWPIRRVTFQSASGWPIGVDMASQYFRGSDDLTSDLPSRADRPARQNWNAYDANGDTILDTPLDRQRVGDYSWIVCVVPTTNAARDALASNPESFSYDVSVVVFYKRVLPFGPAGDFTNSTQTTQHERSVSARVVSTGLNGGELLLKDAVVDLNPFQQLRTGEWILLCGPHPNSTMAEPRFVMNWYQVMSIDSEKSDMLYDPKYERLVTVRGQQWPWVPRTSHADPNSDVAKLSDDLCVGIFRGAVAVHTKTVRLEGEHGAGMALVKP